MTNLEVVGSSPTRAMYVKRLRFVGGVFFISKSDLGKGRLDLAPCSVG